MAQYDGSIRINTEINSKNASAQLMSLESRIAKTADKISSLRSKMNSLKDAQVPTQEYKEISAQIEKAEAEFNKLFEKQEQMRQEGKDYGITWNRINAKMDETGNTIRYARAELQNLVDTGEAFTLGSDTQEYANLGRQLEYLENDYSALVQRRNEFFQRHNIQPGGYERLQIAMEELKVSISRIIHPVESVKSSFSSMAETVKEKVFVITASIINGIAHPFQAMTRIASSSSKKILGLLSGISSIAIKTGKAISNMYSMLKKAASAMFGFGKSAKSSNNILNAGFKNILKYGLGIRSFYVLINKLRNAVKEGFGNLARYSEPVNTSLSSIKSSLLQLKNSLATAFAPILNVIAPTLTMFIDMVSRAVTAVGMLIAALTGQKSFVKATKVQQKYGASLGGTAKAAKEANKQLSSLDKLNNLTSNDSGNSGGGGDGSAGVGDMFETVDIPSKINDLAKMIREAWEKSDFTEIGALIGTKLKDALENIPWDNIQATAVKAGRSLATLINGFVEVEGLGYTIGKTIGEAINTGIMGINAFLDNTHWDSVGIFIGQGLNGIINTVDWAGLGHLFAAKFNAIFETAGNAAKTFNWSDFGKNLASSVNTFISDFNWAENGANLGELAKGFLNSAITFLEETNWQELGEKVADFVGGIDWTGIVSSIAEGIGAALGGFAAFLWGLIEDAWGTVVDWWNDVAFDDGKFTITGLLNGILDAIAGIGSWIYDNVFSPIKEGFESAFGNHELSEITNAEMELAKEGANTIWSIGNADLSTKWMLLKAGAEKIFGGIKDYIVENWSRVGEQTSIVWEKTKSLLSEKWQSIKNKASEIFEGIKNYIVNRWSTVKNQTSIVWGKIKTTISDIWSKIKTTASNSFGKIRDTVVNIWEKIKSKTASIWSGIKDAIKNPINAIIGFINKMISGIVNGINGVINALNSISFTLPDWLGGGSFGLNIPQITAPQIPALATGAVIPPNREFLAVLGDQKHGTNIEAPLSTIEEAVENVLKRSGNSNEVREVTVKVPVNLDGRVIFDLVKKINFEEFNRTGSSPLLI